MILDGAGQAFEGGWNKVKLYFMLGLPTETEEDMKAIAELADKIARRYYEIPKEQRNGKCQITIKYLVLCTEAVYAVPVGTDVYHGRLYSNVQHIVKHAFQKQLNQKSLRYNWHEADVTCAGGCILPEVIAR